MPTRAWELGIGALLALAAISRRAALAARYRDGALAILGLCLIIGSVLFLDKTMPYPSYWAALPCLGTAALIWSGGRSPTLIGTLLSARPMVFIGRISYSLFLWHWVFLVLNRSTQLQEPTLASNILAVAVSFAVSVASYYFVEMPVRRNRARFTNKRLTLAAVTFVSLFFAFGVVGHATNGLVQRFSGEIQRQFAAAIEHNPRRDQNWQASRLRQL